MVRLRDLGQWSGGNTPSKARQDYWTNGTVPWVSPKDMKTPEITSSEDRISEVAMNEGRATLFPPGAVLLVTRSGILSHTLPVATTRIPVTINQDIKALVPRTGVLPNYVAYALKGAGQRILKNCSKHGTTVASIETNALLDFEIPLVALDEQRRIVAEIDKQFSRLDEAIANLQRVKANLKRYKAAVLKTAVEGRLVETEASIARREGRSYETGEQLLQRILETRRGQWMCRGKYKEPTADPCGGPADLPEGWSYASVESLSSHVEYGSSAKTNEDPSGVPVLRMGNIFDGDLFFDNLKYLPADHEEFPKLFVAPGDLLFNRTNSPELVGKTAVFRSLSHPFSFASYLIRVRLVKDGALPEYVATYINSLYGRQWVKSVATQQVGQANVNGTKLQALMIPLPPLEEQRRIVAVLDLRLSILRGVEAEVDDNLQRAQALRHSILQRSFSARALASSSASETHKRKPNLEPASVVIAARVISQMRDVPTFGRVKLQKLLFLSTHHARVGAVNDQYVRMQAGPLDMQMLKGVLERLNQLRWFKECPRPQASRSSSSGYVYERLSQADDYKNHLGVLTAEQLTAIDHICESLRGWSTEDAELLATVYAAWNDLLLWGHPVSDQAIVEQLHEHWHESKKRFSTQQICAMKQRIAELGLEPTGFGKPTHGTAADVHSGDLF